MYDVYFEENFVIFECVDCGELVAVTYEEFEEMLDSEEIELFEVDEDDFDDEFEEEYFVEDEVDDLLFGIAQEIEESLECGDYENVKLLSESYATLFRLIYE